MGIEKLQPKYEELARQYEETEFNPEMNEEHEKLRIIARNIIDCFDWKPDKESFLVITDTKVMTDNPLMLAALEYELKTQAATAKKGKNVVGHYKILTTEASPKSATPLGDYIGEQMRDKPVLIITSMSRSHSKETGIAARGDIRAELLPQEILNKKLWERLQGLARSRRSRIVSITKGHNPYEILTKGAVFEKVENLREKADKVNELMRDVKQIHITTPLGTDLWLEIQPKNKKEKYTEIEDGRVDKPGKLSNYPIGEWSCSPDWNGSSGILVVDGPCGGNINQDILDKGAPLKLTIKDGQVIKKEGGEEALKMWQAYLDGGNNENDDAYRLAELGIGINERALENKPREYWGSSEGEKKYGTCHIALGSNGVFGRTPKDPNFNAAQVHCDMVLGLNTGGEVTAKCFKKDGTSFKLIDKGKPIGY